MSDMKRCPVCRGRGALRCVCWPGDCICGWDDEPCEECAGIGWIEPDWEYDDPVPDPPGNLTPATRPEVSP